MSTKYFLIVTAMVEGATGLTLLASPSLVSAALLGVSLDAPATLVVARVAGTALLAMGVACWRGRHDAASGAIRGLLSAMVLYNAGSVLVLVHARFMFDLSGEGLWPALLLHLALAGWSIACLGNVTVISGK